MNDKNNKDVKNDKNVKGEKSDKVAKSDKGENLSPRAKIITGVVLGLVLIACVVSIIINATSGVQNPSESTKSSNPGDIIISDPF